MSEDEDGSAMPSPKWWPVCMAATSKDAPDRRCCAPYALRRCMMMDGGDTWLWSPDCKHKIGRKGVVQEIHDANGRVGP